MSNLKTQFAALDLFSGCGGLSLGLKQAGFRVVGAIEIDEVAAETYSANHKHVKVWNKDIRRVSGREIMRELGLRKGDLDLLAGCPPCQGFSSMTTRNDHHKREDSRNDLVFHFLRFVRVLRPKTIMMENVPGLARDKRLPRLVTELEKMGYQVTKDVLDAADYYVPQRRKRFILLGAKQDRINYTQPSLRRRTVRQAFTSLSQKRSIDDPLQKIRDMRSESDLMV